MPSRIFHFIFEITSGNKKYSCLLDENILCKEISSSYEDITNKRKLRIKKQEMSEIKASKPLLEGMDPEA